MTLAASQGTPASIKVAALLFFLMAAWRFVVSALPAFLAGSPDAYSDLLDVGLPLLLVWGLLTLKRWAWWLAIIASVMGCVIPAILLGGFEHVMGNDIPDRKLLVQFLTVVGVVSAIELVLLMSPSARAAFRDG
jgi:hypothetical protein